MIAARASIARIVGGALVVAASGLGACAPPPAPPSTVTIRVLDEARQPVVAAEIASGAAVVARTDDAGVAQVAVAGREGSTYPLEVKCPNVYRSPSAPVVVRRLEPGATPPEYVTTCVRTRHKVVVAVRAENGPGLPVLHLGKEVARTDASGAAHVIIEGDLGERVDLTLSTADPKLAKLHPQNPYAAFEIEAHDTLKAFDIKFVADKPIVKKAAGRRGPIAL